MNHENVNRFTQHRQHDDWDEVHRQLLSVQNTSGKSGYSGAGFVQAKTDEDPWIKDHDSVRDYYYLTEREANVRKSNLEKIGEWEEYRIVSFDLKGKKYWRVEMRGPKAGSEEITVDKESTTTDQSNGTDEQSQSEA